MKLTFAGMACLLLTVLVMPATAERPTTDWQEPNIVLAQARQNSRGAISLVYDVFQCQILRAADGEERMSIVKTRCYPQYDSAKIQIRRINGAEVPRDKFDEVLSEPKTVFLLIDGAELPAEFVSLFNSDSSFLTIRILPTESEVTPLDL